MAKPAPGRNQDLVLVVAVISILLVLFAPIPPVALDLLIIVNFAFALTILLLTLYVEKPVAFSTFPSLLLVATLYRLALNVAATRLILTEAHAGDVIGAIGSFAVQGSFVVGLVVFFILVVVQYVVVTSGAQRVSEVAARFVLDSVPGHQMSIDADLNMGLIDQNEAKQRRKMLEKEAAFYGSMDGASKFVKGDAVAGVIILLINIIAGWIIGVAQMGMDWLTALQTFSLLTIGDGIVTQIPALIVSTATGLIVTRSSADRRLSEEILAQLSSVSRIPLLVIGALALLLMMPGMPKWPIAILILVAFVLWTAMRRRKAEALTDGELDDLRTDSAERAAEAVSPIEVRLGRELSEAWRSQRSILSERISAFRVQEERTSGFMVPAVAFHDGVDLGDLDYEILLHGARHGRGAVYPDRTLAIRAAGVATPLPGIEARDPAFGLPGVWVDDQTRDSAQVAGCTLVDPVTVLMTHLNEVVRSTSAQLLTRTDTVQILEGVRSRQPGLVEDLIPAVMSVSDVQRVFQHLLSEHVSIRQADLIVDALVDVGRHTKDHAELTEKVRQRLGHNIFSALRGGHDALAVMSLSPRLETQLLDSVRRSEAAEAFVIEPRLAEQMLKKLIPMVDEMASQRLSPVLLCGAELRRHLKAFTRRSAPRLAVVSVTEVPQTVDLKSFGVIQVE
ncbi:flagellar biosynthesis protein FlhA [Brevundimonas intermedia]|uniref:Flagellar biosynthesis protein FlhA n=1 Tax=Brevundimonas intermedia TaxID=74315 RepID=A0ABQ5TF11_9CAUL|nr:flagellar biosynthesis protein FlhA [Brevundimonas intermedia]GLK50171.1 flagellar biosynthesis protein FlhA [Brevundimonas intermedia]